MRRFLLNIVKFIILELILFFIIFLGVILIHTSNEISAGEFSGSSLLQVFLLSLYNASFLAIIIFCIFFVSDVTKYKTLTLFIPVIMTTIFIGVSLIFIDRSNLSEGILLSDDARIYFSSQSFITYREPLAGTFTEEEFEHHILTAIPDEKTKLYIRSKFIYENKSYHLKQHILEYDYNKVSDILYSIGYYDDVKYCFDGIVKNMIGKATIIRGGNAEFYNNLLVTYSDRYITVTSEDNRLTLTFDRSRLLDTNTKHTPMNDIISDSLRSFSYHFTTPRSIISCIILWFGFALLTMSVFSIVLLKSFKFISFVINVFLTLCFYLALPTLMSFYQILAKLPIHNDILINLLFAGILSVAAVLLLLANIFGIKSGIWEKD